MATIYDRGRSLLPEAAEAWRRAVDDLVPAGATLLDVGAGTGRFAGLFDAAYVVAVEPAARMRSSATSVDLVGWVGGVAEHLPLRAASVDVAWLSCVVHHLDLERAGAELARVVRAGGRVVVRSVFPDRFDELEWMRWFPEARPIDEERMPSLERVHAAWAPSGLELVERRRTEQVVANSLGELADRLAQRAISTLELISDEAFERGMRELRQAADTARPAPIVEPADVAVLRRP